FVPLFLYSLSIFPQSVSAQPKLEDYRNPFSDTYVSTTWAAARNASEFLLPLNSSEIRVQHNRLKHSLPVRLHLRRDRNNKILKRNLVIYITGIISGHDEYTVRRVAHELTSLDLHVAVLPTPWSIECIKSEARSLQPGSFPDEALVLEEIATNV